MTRDLLDHMVVHPARRLAARLVETLATPDPRRFETARVETLDLGLDGVAGDRHAGFTRSAGAREPWYPRGAKIRSGRQVSIVSSDELGEIARALGAPTIEAAWLGANLVIDGAPRLSFLPTGARIFFPSGASVVIEGQNAPCRHAGGAVARQTGRPGDELAFAKVAARLRGLVASVERAGSVAAGDAATIHVPEQWIY